MMEKNKAIDDIKLKDLLLKQNYISDDAIAMSIHLSMFLKKPLLIEGPAGVGKTEIAKVMSKVMYNVMRGWMLIKRSMNGIIKNNCFI